MLLKGVVFYYENDIENIIRNVTNSMAEVLDDEQLQKLQNVCTFNFTD